MQRIQWVGVLVLIIGIIALAGSCSSSPIAVSEEMPTSISYPTVVYELTGSARSVDITLNNASGGIEQYSQISLPQTIIYESFTDEFVYVSMQNCGGRDWDWIRATIYVNGKAIKSSTSIGAYVIVEASGYSGYGQIPYNIDY